MNLLTTSHVSTSRMQQKGRAAPPSRSMVGAKAQPQAHSGLKEFFAVLLRSLGTSPA